MHKIKLFHLSIALCFTLTLLCLSANAFAKARHGTSDAVFEKKHIGEFYDRLATDLKAGRPMVVTVYVALCDNDSQGIVPTRNKKICMGDFPERNLYWASSGGLKGHLQKRGWKRIQYAHSDTDKIAVKGVWTRRLFADRALRKRGIKGNFPVYIVGLGYRGNRIHDAMVDYLHAVSRDTGSTITLKNITQLEYGGRSHIVGYVGHDYFMDVADKDTLLAEAKGTGTDHKGVFGLACVSDILFRPAIQRRNTHILALNTGLTYPSAFTVAGIVRAVAAGHALEGIHREAARAFAEGQGKSVGTMRRALSYGDKPLGVEKPSDSLSIRCRDDWGAKPKSRPYKVHEIRRITIHHQGVNFLKNQDAPKRLKTMQQFHKSKKKEFGDIAYHFIVSPSGHVYEGRPYSAIGATDTDYNPKGHLLICLMGNFDKQMPTPEAEDSLLKLIAWAKEAFKLDLNTLKGHRDHAHTSCPGANLYQLIEDGTIKAKVETILSNKSVHLNYTCAN